MSWANTSNLKTINTHNIERFEVVENDFLLYNVWFKDVVNEKYDITKTNYKFIFDKVVVPKLKW